MTKPMAPVSGDKHDFESLATYYWPCNNRTLFPTPPSPKCNMTTGMPWHASDGHKNPFGNVFDKVPLDETMSAVMQLSAAYFFSKNESYAERAALLLRTWFLNESTLMHPNLDFAAVRPGLNNGSPSGVIAIHDMYQIVDSVGLLAGSMAWTDDDQRQLEVWFEKMLAWLLFSPFGQSADLKPNNHGTWSDVGRSSYALFTGNTEVAKMVASKVINKRITTQIEPDGRMPYEESRENAATYSCMNLRAFFNLACLASHSGVELFNYTSASGSGIRKAFEYMIPFALGKKPWPYKEISENFSWGEMAEIFRRAANAYRYPPYEEMIAQLPDVEENTIINLLFPKQFFP
eukprot:m.276045 g.276045  ORF g.276045 m.276045 type:complete len:347 (+) comp40604_c0_seq57:1094-2134(+)